jgi:hypothetical protein
MKCAYFARPISSYNNPQDLRDVVAIEKLGFHVIEITDEETQIGARNHGMQYFKHIVLQAEALFFKSFPDGSIGSGVAQEIGWADEVGTPIFEIPTHIIRRALDVKGTVDMLRLCGQR